MDVAYFFIIIMIITIIIILQYAFKQRIKINEQRRLYIKHNFTNTRP